MPRYAHISDIHLDHLNSEAQVVAFAQTLIAQSPTAVFLTGDITVANGLVYHLMVLEREMQRPIYFVLGNHDFYGSSIDKVREEMKNLTNSSQFLRYMPNMPYIALSKDTALVGHDGWYDATAGDPVGSQFMMTDWYAIQDFVKHSGGKGAVQSGRLLDKTGLIMLSRQLAKASVDHVFEGIKQASKHHKKIVVLTHFPPFVEGHIYKGKRGDGHALPWYTNQAMGAMLISAAKTFPNISFTVLAGHTHGKAEFHPASNLVLHVADAEYGSPKLNAIIDLT